MSSRKTIDFGPLETRIRLLRASLLRELNKDVTFTDSAMMILDRGLPLIESERQNNNLWPYSKETKE